MRALALLVVLGLVLGAVQALEKDRVLVLVGNSAIQHTHSKYFAILQGTPQPLYHLPPLFLPPLLRSILFHMLKKKLTLVNSAPHQIEATN